MTVKKIAVSDYSFRHDLAAKRKDYTDDLPAFARSIGITGIECMDVTLERHLDDIDEEAIGKYQEHVKTKYGIDIIAITGFMLPGWGFGKVWEAFSMDNIASQLDFQVEVVSEWIEVCGALGIPNMRFDAGNFQASHKVPIYKAIDFNIEVYKRVLTPLCALATERGVKVGVENHGFFTADIKVLTRLLEAIPGLHVTMDTGNWPFESRLEDIREIADKVNFVHAKTHVFGDDGWERHIDFPAIKEIMDDAGFDGWWSVEWEGEGMSDDEGVRASVDLLKRL